MTALIYGHYECMINDTQDKILYLTDWLPILEDQDGEPYFISQSGIVIYFEVIE